MDAAEIGRASAAELIFRVEIGLAPLTEPSSAAAGSKVTAARAMNAAEIGEIVDDIADFRREIGCASVTAEMIVGRNVLGPAAKPAGAGAIMKSPATSGFAAGKS